MAPAKVLDPAVYTLAWIAPLDVEARAALALFDKIHDGYFTVARGHDHVFHAGEIAGYNTILATLTPGTYGTGSAAALAGQVKLLFPNLWLGLLVGVAAGLPRLSHPELPIRDIRLGDVLVAQPSSRRDALVAYDLGRVVDESGRVELLLDGHALASIEPLVLSAASKLRQRPGPTSDSFWQHYRQIENEACDDDGNTFADPGKDLDELWNGGTKVERPPRPQRTRVWYGSIGAGEKLMRDATTRDSLRDRFDLIGLEMEAAGVITSIRVGVIRGVCDYGDAAKNKKWQPYAAAVAAAYAKQLLETMPPSAPTTLVRTAPEATATLRQDCLESLAFPEMETRFRTMDASADGTCRWILTHPEYTRWLGCHGGLLGIKGHPGSGKSTLLKHILDHWTPNPQVLCLSFFFHGRGSALQKTSLGLFRSLLHQVLYQVPAASPQLLDAFKEMRIQYGAKLQWHAADLYKHLELSLSAVLRTQSVCIFIDALDECGKEDAEKLVQNFPHLLTKFHSATQNRIRICFTCRHQPEWNWQPGYQVHVDQLNRDDISIYVKAQLAGSCAHLSGLVVEGAGGSFMWAYLVVRRVLGQVGFKTWKAIEDDIRSTPPELRDLYEKLMQNAGPDSIKLAQWVSYSTRPLSLDEIRWAWFIEPNCHHWSLADCEKDAAFIPSNSMMEKNIGRESHGLVETKRVSDNIEIVQFIHESVGEYFADKFSDHVFSAPGKSFVKAKRSSGTQRAHFRLSQICARYLVMEEIQELASSNAGQEASSFPFLHYATTSWVAHLRQSDIDDDHDWLPTRDGMKQWVNIYQMLERYSPDCPPRGTSLIHVLSRYDIVGALRPALITRSDEIDASDEHDRTPLSWAAASGCKTAVTLLLATKQVHLDTKDKDGWTPLWYAAANLHSAVVQILLVQYNASIRITDNNGQTLLTWAAANGHTVITKLLLAAGKADANSKDGRGWTPLLSAAAHGHEDIVEHLLNQNVDLVWDVPLDKRLLKLRAVSWHMLMRFLISMKLPVTIDTLSSPRKLLSLLSCFLAASAIGTALHYRQGVVQYHSTLQSLVNMPAWLGIVLETLLATVICTLMRPIIRQWADTIGIVAISGTAVLELVRIGFTVTDPLRQKLSQMQPMSQKVITKKLLPTKSRMIKSPPSITHMDEASSGWYGRVLLVWAMERDNEAITQLLLAKTKQDINHKDRFGQTLLLWAAYNGYEATVKLVLGMADVRVDDKDNSGNTSLHYAVQNEDAPMTKSLLAADKANVNARNHAGETPLLCAARNGNKAIIRQLLISRNVDIDVADWSGMTPLLWAAVKGNEDIVRELLLREANAELNHPPLSSGTSPGSPWSGTLPGRCYHPLSACKKYSRYRHRISRQTQRDTLQLLLPDIPDATFALIMGTINRADWYGTVLLLWATKEGYTATVNLLINTGRVMVCRNNSRVDDILQLLITRKENSPKMHSEQSAQIQPAPVKVVKMDQGRQNQLLHAAIYGDSAAIGQLLQTGTIDVNTKNGDGRTALHLAALKGHDDIVQQLLAYTTVNINATDYFGHSPFLLAAIAKHERIAHQLLLKGASIEWKDPTLWSWFRRTYNFLSWRHIVTYYSAMVFMSVSLCSIFIHACQSHVLGSLFAYGCTMVSILVLCSQMWAGSVKTQRTATSKQLLPDGSSWLQAGVQIDVGLPDWYRRALLFWAIEMGYERIINVLVDIRQVDVNGKDAFGRTALIRCTIMGSETTLRLLLSKSRVDINAQDNDGRTALAWAATKGDEVIVKLLLDHGSIVTIADKAGQTSLTLATDKGWRSIVKLLDSKI